jgi:hypothetical protein
MHDFIVYEFHTEEERNEFLLMNDLWIASQDENGLNIQDATGALVGLAEDTTVSLLESDEPQLEEPLDPPSQAADLEHDELAETAHTRVSMLCRGARAA